MIAMEEGGIFNLTAEEKKLLKEIIHELGGSILNFKHFLLLVQRDNYFYNALQLVENLKGPQGYVHYDELSTLMELIDMNVPTQILNVCQGKKYLGQVLYD